ncbi:hypothetical protein EXIGLDRAFT_212975 [Exidia glandulosa HHB12029]|uniref:Uncharacterized protein n=1 Tax=Exidia glandulosa HHB12029 TaxID=1314781 RepID=A0A165EI15_EXIGL|nr:hypothetical protein EXIGLDRAFT_212975 [Exidia glandulosa HHB12029]
MCGYKCRAKILRGVDIDVARARGNEGERARAIEGPTQPAAQIGRGHVSGGDLEKNSTCRGCRPVLRSGQSTRSRAGATRLEVAALSGALCALDAPEHSEQPEQTALLPSSGFLQMGRLAFRIHPPAAGRSS